MRVRHETDSYRLVGDRWGFFTLVRKADGASAYFQGDDADLWERNMTALEGVIKWGPGGSFDQSFDCLCSGYDDILE